VFQKRLQAVKLYKLNIISLWESAEMSVLKVIVIIVVISIAQTDCVVQAIWYNLLLLMILFWYW
jgi:hypothetical protein